MPTTRRQKLFALGLGLLPLPAAALDVVYEGFLEDDGAPANGVYELRVTPQYDAKRGPLQAEPIVFPAVEVSGGQFRLEFSVDDATADEVWLSLAVRGVDDAGEAVTLPGLTKAVAGVGGTCWSTAGNSGTDASMEFLGTLDNQPLVLRTRNAPSLRIEPSSELFAGLPTTVNLIAGSNVNSARTGVQGATVAGGGESSGSRPNRAYSNFATVSGGAGNIAGNDATAVNVDDYSSVGGGVENIASGRASTIAGGFSSDATSDYSSVGGGFHNLADGQFSTVAGGWSNTTYFTGSSIGGGRDNVASGDYSTVGGGNLNTAGMGGSTVAGGQSNIASDTYSTVSGGLENTVDGARGAISGGYRNTVSSIEGYVGGGQDNLVSGASAAIAGGDGNTASGSNSAVGGGVSNTASGAASVVSGGTGNCAGGRYSWAAGQRAKVRRGTASGGGCIGIGTTGTHGDEGTFVWADSQAADFISSGSNQFLVRASGGVGVGTSTPENDIHLVGSANGIGTVGNHVMQIENASTASDADVLALRVNAAGTLSNAVNFITFFGSAADALGTIEGNGAGGVVLSGPGNDFAEYLPKADAAEQIEPGELLGLHAGRVSRRTDGADRLLVASSAPIIAGNDPGADQREQFVLTALVGQAEVRVRGPVQRGDWLVASGNADGLASVINGKNASNPETRLPFGQVVEILASADSDSTSDIRRVRVLLGDNGQQTAERLRELAAENRALREELVRLRDRQNGEIASLQAQLAEIRELMLPAVAERSH